MSRMHSEGSGQERRIDAAMSGGRCSLKQARVLVRKAVGMVPSDGQHAGEVRLAQLGVHQDVVQWHGPDEFEEGLQSDCQSIVP